ncbi:MAG: glycosyltransferase family 2 protein [Gammaproteobacteria bacterium]|nr:glycosyltransferase family 2 protein [Gammaproteobacteria bacterium]
MSTAQALFWISAGFVTYVYVGYPLLIAALSRLRQPPLRATLADAGLPEVTVVIAAYNEAQRLPAKIANLRTLDYPADKLQILVVSDGSTDASASIAQSLPGVRVLAYPQRRGKAHALNLAMTEVRTSFTVFCDVRQELAPDSVRYLISNFCAADVGAASGELVHRASNSHTGQSIGLYWRYEKWIREAESRLHSTVGATGALYAIRTADFTPIAPDTILDDFEIPMSIARGGKRVLFDSRALVFDELHTDSRVEQKRKIRTLTGNFQTFSRQPWLFLPAVNPLWFQFISHKALRLLVPYAMLLALLSSALLSAPIYRLALVLQLGFYVLVAAARRLPAARHNRLVSLAQVFFDMNAAAVIAAWRFASGGADARWEKTT